MPDFWVFLLVILAGLFIGGIIGDAFSDKLPILEKGFHAGFQPFTIDLNVMKFTFGFTLKVNLFSAVGLLLSIFIYKKL